MNRLVLLLAFFGATFCALHFAPPAASAVTIDWVHVGNAGNAADPLTGFGDVSHSYQISKYEVTNRQYVEFLNSNDPSGKNEFRLFSGSFSDGSTSGEIRYQQAASPGKHYQLLAGSAERPVVEVSWYSAIRFTNWLNNGQVPGSTETGAYDLTKLGSGVNYGANIARNANATVFLPSEDEWYKAAYFDPVTNSYFLYPTASNSPPTSTAPTSIPNSATFKGVGITNVGAYSGTTSPYGAFDLAGNVYEWNESTEFRSDSWWRCIRGGGAYDGNAGQLVSTQRLFCEAFDTTSVVGFRVAAIPEPSTGVMAAIGCGLLGLLRRRLSKP
jgi:formylglycine-generating enzyme required for sulfatase activity